MGNEPVHIGLNAHLLSLSQSYRGAGISWYIVNLLKSLGRVSPEFLRYSIFLRDRAFQGQAPALSLRFSRLPTQQPAVRILWEQFIQPVALSRAGVDLLHALAFVSPVAVKVPVVVTVYDLSFLRYPEAFRPFNRWYLSHFTARSVKQAKAVVAISESTRQDVINFLKTPPERVHTVYCGVDAAFHPLPPAQVAAFRARQQLPEQFILFLGTLEPRKNVAGLLRAYAQWRAHDSQAWPLVLAGGKGWYYAEIFKLVEALNLTAWVRFPGYVPQDELPLWYNAASLFVYPSHFEGFGLPVLEAMACGTPVITSTAASLPEVIGRNGAGCLVDPQQPEALAETMARVINDEELRRSMAAEGLARARQFHWDKTAHETIEIYKNVLGL